MIFYGGFSTASYEYKLRDAGFCGFFDRVLDKRFIHDRQHFFGHGFRSR
jgi:hypothetical protein